MKTTDLMIDDWVVYQGDTEYDNPIKIEGMDIATDALITSDREDIGLNGVEPIPLTAEILERNGFSVHVEQYSVSWLWLEDERFELAYADGEFTTAIGLLDISVKYVHQLQHLLKECGIEKEIEL